MQFTLEIRQDGLTMGGGSRPNVAEALPMTWGRGRPSTAAPGNPFFC